ncbi:MAG: hypothetical protein PGN07_12775 [Aeromicrobium erythreum]
MDPQHPGQRSFPEPAGPTPRPAHGPGDDSVVVDCDSCVVRGPRACGDCVVSVLLGGPPQGVEIDADERHALDLLADGGLVPPLRLVVPTRGPESHAG